MDHTPDEEELDPQVAAKLQLWDAVCKDAAVVRDAEFYEILSQVNEAKETGKTAAISNTLEMALERISTLANVSIPMHPVGDLTEEDIAHLHIRASEHESREQNDEYISTHMHQLNEQSLSRGNGPLPGCEADNEGQYYCFPDPDIGPEIYGQSLLDAHASRRMSDTLLNDPQNKEVFTQADDLLVNEALKGNVSVVRQEEMGLCRVNAILQEAGIFPHSGAANIRFVEPPRIANANEDTAHDINGHGYMLYMRDETLRVVFTDNSEKKFALWPSLVDAYNMKHPEQEPLAFTREKGGAYSLHANEDVLRGIAADLHRGLPGLLTTPERSIPQVTAAEHDMSLRR